MHNNKTYQICVRRRHLTERMDDGILPLCSFFRSCVQHSTGSLFLIGSAAIVRNSAVQCGVVRCSARLVFPLRRQFHGRQHRQSCCCCLGSSVLRLARENSRQAGESLPRLLLISFWYHAVICLLLCFESSSQSVSQLSFLVSCSKVRVAK